MAANVQTTMNPGPGALELVGGALCLDFANTVEGRGGDQSRDFLRHASDLIAWGRRAGAISDETAEALTRDSASLAGSYRHALEARELVYRVFTAVAHRMTPARDDLWRLREEFVRALGRADLASEDSSGHPAYRWQWNLDKPHDRAGFDVLVGPVLESAVTVLQTGRRDRVRQCSGGGAGPCNWLFIDTTKGGNRKWCSMADCGARSKWNRQNARRRGASPS